MLKFGQIEMKRKEFHSRYEVTDIFSIDLEKITVSDAVTANKCDTRFSLGYEAGSCQVISLFIKTPADCSSNGVSQYNENSTWKMGFNVSEDLAWVRQYEAIWIRIEELIFEKLAKSPLNNGQFINPKLITWEDVIKTRFHGRCVPFNAHCEATGVLKIDSVYQQGSKLYLQVFLKECKYRDKDIEFKSWLSDDDEDSVFDTVF
jgi:hypothetical protein